MVESFVSWFVFGFAVTLGVICAWFLVKSKVFQATFAFLAAALLGLVAIVGLIVAFAK